MNEINQNNTQAMAQPNTQIGYSPMFDAEAQKIFASQEETEETKKMKAGFRFFGPATFIYAMFYALCMYRNASGVTFPFFVGGSLFYMCVCLGKLTVTLKRGSAFYWISMLLLSISTFYTDDYKLILFNKTGIFFLTMIFLLSQFYDTKKWGFGKFLGSMFISVFAAFGEICRPFSDAVNCLKKEENKKNKKTVYVIIGLVIAIPLFVIMLLLLSSADIVFKQVTDGFMNLLNPLDIFGIGFSVCVMFFAAYCILSYLCKKRLNEEVKDKRTGEPVVAIIITGVLSVLYLFFSMIQIVYLFVGNMELPENYTYSMYAREGFFQLLAVSIMNLIIVLVVLSRFRNSGILKGILTVMSGCTFIMIASSALRMVMYIRFYYLTFLRVFVLWALLLLALLFVGVVITIYKDKFPLFRYSMVVVTLLYLGLTFSRPESFISKINIAYTEEYAKESMNQTAPKSDFFLAEHFYQDYEYLSQMSADASETIVPYLEKIGYDLEGFYANMKEEGIPAGYRITKLLGVGRYSRYNKEEFGYYYLRDLEISYEDFGIRTYNISRAAAFSQVKQYR